MKSKHNLLKITSPIKVFTTQGEKVLEDTVAEITCVHLFKDKPTQVELTCNFYESESVWKVGAKPVETRHFPPLEKTNVGVHKTMPLVKNVFANFLLDKYGLATEDVNLTAHTWEIQSAQHRAYLSFEDIADIYANQPAEGEVWDGILLEYVRENNLPFSKNGYGYWCYFPNEVKPEHYAILVKYKAFIQTKTP